jgi:hypothetical protein
LAIGKRPLGDGAYGKAVAFLLLLLLHSAERFLREEPGYFAAIVASGSKQRGYA